MANAVCLLLVQPMIVHEHRQGAKRRAATGVGGHLSGYPPSLIYLAAPLLPFQRENWISGTPNIDSSITLTLGWMTNESICVYKYGSSIKFTNDECFKSHFFNCPHSNRKVIGTSGSVL